MNLTNAIRRVRWFGLITGSLGLLTSPLRAQPTADGAAANLIRIVEAAGVVELSPTPATTWVRTQTNQLLRPFDRLRTGPNSRVALLWSDHSVVPLGELTEIEILPPHARNAESGLHLVKGVLSFFHRDKPGRIRVITAGTTAGIEGTEFVVEAASLNGTERAILSVIDGQVAFGNDHATLVLTNGQQAIADLGQAPVLTAGFLAENILQWAFYYPAVLDLRDLPLTRSEQAALADSLAAYRAGDLLPALAAYPANRLDISAAEEVYLAALLLAVGQIAKTESILDAPLPVGSRLRSIVSALRTLIASVKRQPNPSKDSPNLSTELLAASYYEQSRASGEASLRRALDLARQAAEQSPEFGFAWARVAELEFSFGHVREALEALNRSLALSPRNAQALALKGFLLAAQNKTRSAIELFDQALAVDPALGNAWLGRGLCRIRRGDRPGGREDLLIAAALEPQRALLRSYLGKAWSDSGDTAHAFHELALAKHLDPADPTPWLYSALLKQENNQVNEAVDDLESSLALNDNRRLYSSQQLLDEQRAVKGVNLATAYKRAGMDRVSRVEATKAVSDDYSSYSAHQFLSDSFNSFRDPARFNLRFETVWFNELLLANLLSQAGDTPLSQHASLHEYSNLFEQDGAHLGSQTEYRSDGQWQELASQSGRFGNTAWALDLDYQHNDGTRPNNELSRIEWYATIKQQLTLQDSLLLLTKYQDYHSGDNFQYYDPADARPYFRYDEQQSPIALLGYHHEWQPGVHTLFLGGRLQNDQSVSDRDVPQILLRRNANGDVVSAQSPLMDVEYHSEFEVFTGELNQIFQRGQHTVVAGGRFQSGTFRTSDRLTLPANVSTNLIPFFNDPPASDSTHDSFERFSVYGYYTWEPWEGLLLTPGVAYDHIIFPSNYRYPPISSGEDSRARVNPKAALVWKLDEHLTLRGAYSQSLGGVSLDESVRLEPTQLAGFSQSFRSVISESLVGSVSAPDYESAGAAIDLKASTRTYVGLQAESLRSDVHREVGIFNRDVTPPLNLPSSTSQFLDYEEQSFSATLNQLLSDEWAVGAGYRFTRSELRTRFPEIPVSVSPQADKTEQADLQQVNLYVRFNHPSGFFAHAESQYYHQQNQGYAVPRPVENLFQQNFFLGYRLRRERGELSVGVLNAFNEDYRLNPLNPYFELPRERVFVVRLKFNL